MYSQLLLADLEDGSRRTLTLCYPVDADSEHGFVSVLSPIGAGLLAAGSASWRAGARPTAWTAARKSWPCSTSRRRAATTRFEPAGSSAGRRLIRQLKRWRTAESGQLKRWCTAASGQLKRWCTAASGQLKRWCTAASGQLKRWPGPSAAPPGSATGAGAAGWPPARRPGGHCGPAANRPEQSHPDLVAQGRQLLGLLGLAQAGGIGQGLLAQLGGAPAASCSTSTRVFVHRVAQASGPRFRPR